MGGHQVPSQGPGDDGWDEEGYDESQRAEILEVTRDGPSDGVLLTDIEPDLGDDSVEDEPIDEIDMDSEEVGETDASARLMRAIEQVTADSRFHTPDLGGEARTAEVTAAVIEAIQQQ